MEKTDKPLTRDALVSMQVIDAKGQLVGKVKDVAFAVGKIGIGLSVENEDGEIQSIGWEEVQAASDFIILKPVPQSTYQAQPQQQTQQTYQTCPSNNPLSHFAQHAIDLSHGFHNTKDGTATTTRNTFNKT